MDTTTLRENLRRVHACIDAAAVTAGHSADQVTLIAVTKTHPAERVLAAYAAGVRDVGENQVAEAMAKQAETADLDGLRWHMIGHLIPADADSVVGRFTLIHSVDTMRLARALNQAATRQHLSSVDVLLQVNVSGEHRKYGFPADTQKARDKFCATAADIALMFPRLRLRGLMTMAPFVEDVETVRPIFSGLRTLRDRLARELPQVDWTHLSMGMTNDFDVAVEEGATLVRIGTAIFGERKE